MPRKLVMVKSPSKAKTIKKFLGPDFDVRASVGHVIDLPSKGLGINVRRNFAPKYEVIKGKEKVVEELIEASREASEVFLAPDPDREGEAISWHLANALGVPNARRAVFNEITKQAVQQGIDSPREIDVNLVNAQQTRRILDRLVGYKISPLLWRKVVGNTSAGRVQSVALRLICDREGEIRAFVSEEYWTIDARLIRKGDRKPFMAALAARLERDETGATVSRSKVAIGNAEEAEQIVRSLRSSHLAVLTVETKEVKRQPPLPYTTSTLQQDASARLRFSPKKTMSLAQALYEGVDLDDRGTQGLITYMRTDSTRIAEEATVKLRDMIAKQHGKKYIGGPRTARKNTKTNIQDAHEAIRPTDIDLTPDIVRPFVSADSLKLYTLIWQRFVASGMAAAVFNSTAVEIQATPETSGDTRLAGWVLRATGSQLAFPGFYAVWPRDEDKDSLLPVISTSDAVDLVGVDPQQHFTQPPPRYTEASLIKDLEELGIGRPSTYVPILTTIQQRKYVRLEGRKFIPEWLGETVNELMTRHFPQIVDIRFTADMEHKLDNIEEGQLEWVSVLGNFYEDFKKTLTDAEDEISQIEKPVEQTDQVCPLCGSPMVIKLGRYGRFLSCSNYPECKHSEQLLNKIGVICPKCGGDIIERTTKRGRQFYGCSRFPACDFASWDEPVAQPCANCGGLQVIAGRNRATLRCTVCGTTTDIEEATPPAQREPEPAGAAV